MMSNNINTNNTNKNTATAAVSYESFAPRSTAQVARLSRIAALTPGPTARAAAAAAAAAAASSSIEPRGWLCQAMSVVSSSSPSTSSSSPSSSVMEEEKYNESEQENENNENNHHDSSSSSSLRLVHVALQQAQQLADLLTHELKHTTSLRLACCACLNIAQDVGNAHASLILHSSQLSAAADRLQDEAEMLQNHAHDIGIPLQHYDAVDRIGLLVGVLFKSASGGGGASSSSSSSSNNINKMKTVRGLAKTKVDNDEFPALLDEIDDAVEYFEKKSGGREALLAHEKQQQASSRSSRSSGNGGRGPQMMIMSGNLEYYRRALVLQEAALDLIKQAVADRITSTTLQIAAQMKATTTAASAAANLANPAANPAVAVVVADQLEASLIYTRFHGISTRSHRLLSLLKCRSHKSVVYVDLLHTCRTTYCACRESLLRQPLRDYMERLYSQHGAVGMARLASVFLMRLLTVETMLFLDFFGVKETTANNKISSSDVVVSSNAIADSSSAQDRSGAAVTTTMDKTFQDPEFQTYLATLCTSLHRTVRRSLVTCLDLDTLCQMVSVLRQEGQVAARLSMTLAAARSMAQVMEDAQERVIFCANTTLRREVLRWKASPSDLDYPKKLQVLQQNKIMAAAAASSSSASTTSTTAAVADGEDDVNKAEQHLEQVYESWFPPMRTVLRILSKIFRVVEPVVFEDLALQSIQACTKSLKDGATFILKRQGVLHADLFLVKHLLILREQLSPFDMELRTVERQLDFSDAGKAVARFLANRNRRIFSMSTENNALMTLLREGVSVQESSVDSKRDLEEALKSACNDFIEHTSTSLAGPVLNLWEECKMDKDKKPKANTRNADYIQDLLVNKTLNDLPSKMDNLLECMGLYLDNPATQSILLKPAIRRVTRATEGVRRWVQTLCAAAAADGNGDDESGGWNAEKRADILEALNRVDDLVKKVNKPGITTAAVTAVATVDATAATPAVAAVATTATPETASSSS